MAGFVKAYRVKVLGRVQRVGYRRFVSDLADEMGILGYVRNERDHSVMIFAQGSDEALARFLDDIKKPPMGLVKSAFLEEVEPEPGLSFFETQLGSVQEELTDGFGAMEQEFRDYRHEFTDYRQEFRDYRQEFRDYRQEFREFASRTDRNFLEMSEKYGVISEKLTQTMEALRIESAETRKMLAEAIESLNRDSAYTREELKRSVDNLVTAVQQLVQATSKK